MTTNSPSSPSGTPRWFLPAVVGLLAVIVGLVAFTVLSDDDETTDAVATTSAATTTTVSDNTDATTTTSEPVATTETAPVTDPVTEPPTSVIDPSVYETAVWPLVTMSVRYDTPEAAVKSFAEGFVGFTDPQISEFMQGDSRSGEFEVRPTTDGPASVVFVRQLGPDDSWWVLGSATENIVVSEPAALAMIDSPLVVAGEAFAFEGTVEVQLLADGSQDLLIDSFVTGGGDQLQPFTGSFDFTSPGEGAGALVLLTRSAENGEVWEASTLRVYFANS